MFKKSLLALALAGVAMSASAVEFNAVTAKTVSVEGLAVSGKAVEAEANAIAIKSAAEYSVGDLVEFTVSGAEFVIADRTFALTDTPAANNSTVTFGPIVKEAGKLVFRVTAVTAPTTGTPTKSTVGNTFTLTDTATAASGSIPATTTAVGFKITSIAKDGKVVVTSKATIGSSGTEIDKAKDNTATVFTGANEYAVTIAQKDSVVDVSKLRKAFATEGKPTLAVAVTPANVSAVDFTSYTMAVTGDFTGVDSLTTDTADKDALKIATDKKSASAELKEAAVEGKTVTSTFGLPAKDADKVALIAPQTFNVTLTGKAGTSSYQLASGKFASWTLNGASADIAFLPFGDRYAQAIYVTNKGSVEGAITVDLIAGGKTYTGNLLTKSAAANTVTNIGPEVMELVKTKGITATEISMKIVVNSPNEDVTISGLYYDKTDADRVKVK